jgi:ribonuclease P protein component
MTNFRFIREERLKSIKVIDGLFKGANSISQYPLLLLWKEQPETELPGNKKSAAKIYPVQFALSVPKRKFKSAVIRNLLRRRIREAYRLNKHLLYKDLEKEEKTFAFMIIYTGKEIVDSKKIEQSMKKIISKFLR